MEWIVEPDGVVTRILFGLFSKPHSILYPGGKKVLNPWIRFGCPANRSETRLITPGVSILHHHQSLNRAYESFSALNLRLALEVLHNIKESVIDVRLLGELDLDLIQIAQGILRGVTISSVLQHASLMVANIYI